MVRTSGGLGLGGVSGFVLLLVAPLATLTPAVAQDSGESAPAPKGTSPAAAVEYLSAVLRPGEGSFDEVVGTRDLERVDIRGAETAHYTGSFKLDPCPDRRGRVHGNATVNVDVGSSLEPMVQSSRIELTIAIEANDHAGIEQVEAGGRYFDKKRNRRGNLEDSRSRVEYDRGAGKADATVDNEGAYEKQQLQKRADAVAASAQALAEHAAELAKDQWSDGHTCVRLDVTPPSKKVKARQKFPIEVTATSTKDGEPVKGAVSADLEGVKSIKPGKAKQAPATFRYVAGKKKGDKGTITFEQRSRRGVGKAQVEYVIGAPDFKVVGISPSDGYTYTGVKCDGPEGEWHIRGVSGNNYVSVTFTLDESGNAPGYHFDADAKKVVLTDLGHAFLLEEGGFCKDG